MFIVLPMFFNHTVLICNNCSETGERESGAAEIDAERKKPEALQQYFAVKDKVISTLPSGAHNTHSISNSQSHRSVFSSCLEN